VTAEKARRFLVANRPEAFLFLVTVILWFYFTPVMDEGDAGDYLRYAAKFLGENSEVFPFRSPLYPIVLAFFQFSFGMEALPVVIPGFQLVLHLFTAIGTKRIFQFTGIEGRGGDLVLFLAYFNLSALYYTPFFITESLSAFLFVWSIYTLLRSVKTGDNAGFALSGLITGLLILARYNLLPVLPLFFLFVAGVPFLLNRKELKKGVKPAFVTTALFGGGVFVILLGWSFGNIAVNGSFGLFPGAGVTNKAAGGTGVPWYVGRNALIATIDSTTKVSSENRPVLEIFLKSRAKINAKTAVSSTSWMNLLEEDDKKAVANAFNGYKIYLDATEGLYTHFGMTEKNEAMLNYELGNFYQEVYSQRVSQVNAIRVISLAYSFWVSSALENRPEKGDINFNVLPGWMILLHKLWWFGMMAGFMVFSLVYLWKVGLRNPGLAEYCSVFMIILVYSLILTNVVFNTINDASRFKFPVEPLVAGLMVSYLFPKISRYFPSVSTK